MTDAERDAIREALDKLYVKHGTLTPDLVVRAARAESSPLHQCFEWDDSAAAQAWREEQARTLIRSIRVEITTDTVTISTVRYVRDPNAKSDEQGYTALDALQDDKKSARAALLYECDRLLALVERVRGIAFALGLASEAEAAIVGIGTLKKRAAA